MSWASKNDGFYDDATLEDMLNDDTWDDSEKPVKVLWLKSGTKQATALFVNDRLHFCC